MRRVICLQISTVCLLGGGTISLNYKMNMDLMTLGRQEYIKQSQQNNFSEIRKLMNSIWNNKELPEEWKELIIVPNSKKGDKQIVVIRGAYHFCQIRTKFCPKPCCQC